MKKAKLLCLSMLASMVLAGCGSARASFKDINVEKRMENADVALLSAQIKNELKEVLDNLISELKEVSDLNLLNQKLMRLKIKRRTK